LNETGEIVNKRREAFTHQVKQLVLGRLQERVDDDLRARLSTDLDPYAAADELLQGWR
jgi:hypothetical protein